MLNLRTQNSVFTRSHAEKTRKALVHFVLCHVICNFVPAYYILYENTHYQWA